MKFDETIEPVVENMSSILNTAPSTQLTAPKPKMLPRKLNASSARAAELKDLNKPRRPIRSIDLKRNLLTQEDEDKLGNMIENLKYVLALSANTKYSSYANTRISPMIQFLEKEAAKLQTEEE